MTAASHLMPDTLQGRVMLLIGAVAVALLVSVVVLTRILRPAVDVNTFYPEEGATMDDVRTRYGPPSKSYTDPDGRATWYYYTGKLGLGFFCVGVKFGTTGRVESSFNH